MSIDAIEGTTLMIQMTDNIMKIHTFIYLVSAMIFISALSRLLIGSGII